MSRCLSCRPRSSRAPAHGLSHAGLPGARSVISGCALLRGRLSGPAVRQAERHDRIAGGSQAPLPWRLSRSVSGPDTEGDDLAGAGFAQTDYARAASRGRRRLHGLQNACIWLARLLGGGVVGLLGGLGWWWLGFVVWLVG